MKDEIIEKQKELIALYESRLEAKSVRELIRIKELAALEQESKTAIEQIKEAFEPIQLESKGTELHPVDLEQILTIKSSGSKKPDLNNIIFGPGNDNYGRNIPPWKEQKPNKEADDMSKHIEAIFKNTQRIHGKSELDWIKVASYKAVRYINTHYAEAYSKKSRREELEKFMEYLEEEVIDIVYQNDEQGMKYLINQYLNQKS